VRSTARRIADSPGQVVDFIAEFRPATVVADVEPLVAAWDSAAAEVERRAARFAEKLAAAMPRTLRLLVFASNSRMPVPADLRAENIDIVFVSAARKPWVTRYLAAAPRPIVVVGDQVVTDGLLAVRLRAAFIHFIAEDRPPWWPRLQAVIGKPVARIVFRPSPDSRRAG
jgi:predicted HAD superfamily phosphohydrolase YqeG